MSQTSCSKEQCNLRDLLEWMGRLALLTVHCHVSLSKLPVNIKFAIQQQREHHH